MIFDFRPLQIGPKASLHITFVAPRLTRARSWTTSAQRRRNGNSWRWKRDRSWRNSWPRKSPLDLSPTKFEMVGYKHRSFWEKNMEKQLVSQWTKLLLKLCISARFCLQLGLVRHWGFTSSSWRWRTSRHPSYPWFWSYAHTVCMGAHAHV